MSYLGTLVNTPPAAASAASATPRGGDVSLERHVEVESSASLPVSVASEHVATGPEQRPVEQAQATPAASVEDALRAAFEWVSPRPITPAMHADPEMSASARSARSAALDVHAQPLAVPMEATQSVDARQAPQPLEHDERTLAQPALPQPAERTERVNASSETIEQATFESMMHTLEPKPRHRALPATRAASPEAAAATAEQELPARAQPVQVRIGTISLNVRTPAPLAPAPLAPAPKAAAPVAAPAPARPAPSAAFAFSARRHHLRWG